MQIVSTLQLPTKLYYEKLEFSGFICSNMYIDVLAPRIMLGAAGLTDGVSISSLFPACGTHQISRQVPAMTT